MANDRRPEGLTGAPRAGTLAIVIPVFDEGALFPGFIAKLGQWIPELLASHRGSLTGCELVIVDDGSRLPLRATDFPLPASGRQRRGGVHLLRHAINLGQGAAVQTGIAFARDSLRCETYVLLDADGQHSPADIPRLIQPVIDGRADIVFGSRFLGTDPLNMPVVRRLMLRGAIWLERAITGLEFTDSHNGFVGFGASTASILDLTQNRMAYATELKQVVARHQLRFLEVPVEVSYSEATLAKGQRNLNALTIVNSLLRGYFFQG